MIKKIKQPTIEEINEELKKNNHQIESLNASLQDAINRLKVSKKKLQNYLSLSNNKDLTDEEFDKIYASFRANLNNQSSHISDPNLLMLLSEAIIIESDIVNTKLLLGFAHDNEFLLNQRLTNISQSSAPQQE